MAHGHGRGHGLIASSGGGLLYGGKKYGTALCQDPTRLIGCMELPPLDPEILGSTPAREDGGGSEREELHLADHGQVGMTRGQQALYMARQRMQISRTDAEIHQVVHTLALALGANWPQAGTHKALLAVLILLDHPEMSEHEICASTGASSRNFKRWKSKVLKLGPLPPH